MGKELDELRRFQAELKAQDRILQTSRDREVPMSVLLNLKKRLGTIGESCPELANLAESFMPNARVTALQSQIATADAAVAAQIEAWEHILDLRVSAEKAETVVRLCIENGQELEMEAPGSQRNVDFLKTNRQHWIEGTQHNLEKVFVSDIHARRFERAVVTNAQGDSNSSTGNAWGRPDPYEELRGTIRSGISFLKSLHMDLYLFADGAKPSSRRGTKVFFGHGRSPAWRELKDYVLELGVREWEEFNKEPVAGRTTVDRLKEMLSSAAFAFIVMTAEDVQADGEMRARQNVIHEAGLFQGRLGFERAIVLVEDGCSGFSNIDGLTVIPFPRGQVRSSFGEVQRTLAREKLIR
jgi:predicted nucleotide-binding protein with TIR-like domain